jgi:hypothetical protein
LEISLIPHLTGKQYTRLVCFYYCGIASVAWMPAAVQMFNGLLNRFLKPDAIFRIKWHFAQP